LEDCPKTGDTHGGSLGRWAMDLRSTRRVWRRFRVEGQNGERCLVTTRHFRVVIYDAV
jgi:hypothetical protein